MHVFIFSVIACASFSDDVNMPPGIQIYVKDHDCNDNIEKLYYSSGYEACCIHCGEYLHDVEEDDDFYPQCNECQEDPIRKRPA